VTLNPAEILDAEKIHLAQLIEAIQRCVYFLDVASRKLPWPLDGDVLNARKKDAALFEVLAAFNERFAKLQDVQGAAMGHACLLSGESRESFLKVLAHFEKQGVIESVTSWQIIRTARNFSAHDYETDYRAIADHFNALHQLLPTLYRTAWLFAEFALKQLGIGPATPDFSAEFRALARPGNSG
jgi:hypothetical protein